MRSLYLGVLAVTAIWVSSALGQTGPHVAQARVDTLFVSPDGARIVTGTAWDIAEWDAKTGGLIWSNSYTGLGLTRVSSSATLSPDGRYLTTYVDNSYGIVDLLTRTGWPLSQRIGGWTYNGKARNDKSGVDIQTGNYLPLTQLEQDVVPLGNGTYYSYNAKQQNYHLFDPATGKSTKLDKKGKEDLMRRKDLTDHLSRWLDRDRLVRVLHDTGEVVVESYSSKAELNRFRLKIGRTDWGYYAPIAVVPGPEPLLLVSGDTSYQKGSQSIYRGFLTAYKMPSGEVAYTIALHGAEEEAIEQYRQQNLSEEEWRKKNAPLIAAREVANNARATGKTYEIGQKVGDGIVVYVDGSGQHGLILELTEQASGKPNDVGPRAGGDAWFLPTLDEWKTVYGERRRIEMALARESGAALGKNGYYWTATRVSYSGAANGPVIANNWTYQPLSNDAREAATYNILAALRRMRAF